MSAKIKDAAEGTRERIAGVAEDLFRRIGFAKTTVADIAAELGMSSANVYRFFPSKNAIVETICGRCLADMEAQVIAVARSEEPAPARIVRLFTTVAHYHLQNFLSERRVHEMVLVAIEHNWANIEAHKARICAQVEAILREGIQAGQFVPHDPARVAGFLMVCSVRYCHPVMLVHVEEDRVDAEIAALFGFVLRSITVDRPTM